MIATSKLPSYLQRSLLYLEVGNMFSSSCCILYFTCKFVKVALYFLDYWADNTLNKSCVSHSFCFFVVLFVFIFYLYSFHFRHNTRIWDFSWQLPPCCFNYSFALVKAADSAFCQMCHKKSTVAAFLDWQWIRLRIVSYYTVTSYISLKVLFFQMKHLRQLCLIISGNNM